MKQAMLWKQIDLAGQILMLLPLTCLFTKGGGYAIGTYFTVGGWQAISCALHALLGTGGGRRGAYGRTLLWVLGIFAVCCLLFFAFESENSGRNILHGIGWCAGIVALMEAFMMLIAGPLMAFWYADITVTEISMLKGAAKHRQEVHWKL